MDACTHDAHLVHTKTRWWLDEQAHEKMKTDGLERAKMTHSSHSSHHVFWDQIYLQMQRRACLQWADFFSQTTYWYES